MTAIDAPSGGVMTASDVRFAALYDAHVRDVYRYVHRMCLDRAIAEDVTHDVFVAALDSAHLDVSLGWLLRSARNRLIDVVRRQTTHGDKLRMLAHGHRARERDDVEQLIESIRMREAMERLRPDHRICLMIHYVDGCTVSELADALGRSYRGAEGLLARARAALRHELESAQ